MVVLVILAIVATVALQTLQPRVAQQRFDAATAMLKQIQDATIGSREKYQLDGTPLISGFVADVGRTPSITPGAITTNNQDAILPQQPSLAELWDPESPLAQEFPFRFRPGPNQPIDYSTIRIPCGWRGPYLQLAPGTNELRGPWGRRPELTASPAGLASSVQIELPATEDTPEESVLKVELDAGTVSVTGKVLMDDADNSNVIVSLLTPNPNSSLNTLVALVDEDPLPDSFLFSDVPVGLRAIVCDVDGQRRVKYLQIPHVGASVCFDFQSRQPAGSVSTSGSVIEEGN